MTDPFALFLFLQFVALFIILIYVTVWPYVHRRILKNASGLVFYNAACKLALGEKLDDSMALLRQAIVHGYSNFDHIMQDRDLELVRRRQDFPALIAEKAKQGEKT